MRFARCVTDSGGIGFPRPFCCSSQRHAHCATRYLLIRYASMIVPYFTSMFGTSHSGSFPSRR